MNQTEASRRQLDRFQQRALILGIVGALLCLADLFFNGPQFFQSYLFGYVFWLEIALGCLAIVMIHHLAGGPWGFVIRRLLEAGMMTLPLLGLLFVPILLGMSYLYPWAVPANVAGDELLQHKRAYLNGPFFSGRAVLYFVIWIGLAYLLNRWSIEQDKTLDPTLARRSKLVSGPGLGLLGLTVTFASIDWLMSLEPHWFSTIYGIMFIVGAIAATFAFAILLLALLAQHEPLTGVVSAGHFNDLGNFLLGGVMLWAYIALSQYLIIWSGNLPEETPWYFHRTQGGWEWIGLLLIIFHFVVPFLVLLSRTAKRRVRTLATVAAIIMVMRLVDLFWLTAPAFHPERLSVHWLDLAAPLGIGGVWLAVFARQLKKKPLLPLYDLRMEEEVLDHGRKVPS